MEKLYIITDIVLTALSAVLLIVLLGRKNIKKGDVNRIAEAVEEDNKKLAEYISIHNQKQFELIGGQIGDRQDQGFDREKVQLEHISAMEKEQFAHFSENQRNISFHQHEMMEQMTDDIGDRLETIYKRLENMEASNRENLEKIRDTMNEGLRNLREENSKKLDEIKETVDEKLQDALEKRISESFKSVSEQLAAVYRGLGEMQSLAQDVGGLKKVLSGVKTRGILGEYQAAALLSEILSPEQYDTNVATVPESTERVEFALKLPGNSGNIYLPIDSKFPGERYQQLLDAQEKGDRSLTELAYRALDTVIRQEAKDIREKYICPPYTTNFGIMFLPFEGLYAEVVNRGLLEELQRTYSINIAGPSTLAALLNSLQMGFKTLAIQKKSAEVWNTLAEVKSEFDKFGDVMLKMQNHLNLTAKDLDILMGTRTRAIERKLNEIQGLPEALEAEEQ